MSANIGKVIGVNGNLLKVEFENPVILNEVAYAQLSGTEVKLKAEVIRVRGNQAELQVFEDTTGLKIGDSVEFTGDLLSVELGPGLLTQVFDGLQNPLPALAEECGFFLQRGRYLDPFHVILSGILHQRWQWVIRLNLAKHLEPFPKVYTNTASWCPSLLMVNGPLQK